MISPCKGCPDRSITCHGSCDKYAAYHEWRREYLAAQRAAMEAYKARASTIKWRKNHTRRVKQNNGGK